MAVDAIPLATYCVVSLLITIIRTPTRKRKKDC